MSRPDPLFQATTLSFVNSDSTSDRFDHSSLSMRVWNTQDLEEYLHEMLYALQNDEKTLLFQLSLNEKHRIQMMRTIMGMSKFDFKHELRKLQFQQQWERADTFIRQDLQPLMEKGEVDAQQVPNFSAAIQQYLECPQTQQQSCTKFFSALARGRTYQGKMDRVLQTVASHLLPKYQQVVNDLSEKELLQLLVEDQKRRCTTDDNVYLLQQCLDMNFVQAPPEAIGDGKARGERGEVDLTSYLRARYQHDSNYRVLAPVWIRPFSKHHHHHNNNNNNKCQFVLEVPPECIQSGMTSEYDAMVVRTSMSDGNRSPTCTIHEVWDAKATLDLPAMYDILRKKVSSLETLLGSNVLPNSKFVIASNQPDSLRVAYTVEVEGTSEYTPENTTITAFPKIGLFGSCLPTPRAAARRLQVTVCEALLESDREFVRHILDANKGKTTPPIETVQQYARRILQLVQKVQPIVVVSDTTVDRAHMNN